MKDMKQQNFHSFLFLSPVGGIGDGWDVFVRTVYHDKFGEDGTSDIFLKHCKNLQETERVFDCLRGALA